MLEIKASVALITGGAGGIGLALARYWVRNEGKVVLADVMERDLAKAEAEIRAMGGDVVTSCCDVTKEDDCSRLADLAIARFGRINLIAPFAGIIKDALMVSPDGQTGKVTAKMSVKDFQLVMDINVTGVFLTVRECTVRMIENNCKGLICLVSSVASQGTAGQINYASSKAAMSVMPKVITSELFRRNLADRIRCVAIAPGLVGTPMVQKMNQKAMNKILEQVPICRLIEPQEVASFVGEIYRNEAMAGETFFIHGGLRVGSKG